MSDETKVEVKPATTRKAPKKAEPKKVAAPVVRKQYSPELKAKVISEVQAGEKMTVVSKRHGVSYMTCVGWLDAARRAGKGGSLPLAVSNTKAGGELRVGRTQSGRAFINKDGMEIVLEASEVQFLLDSLK